ncbi:hypothetical protein F8S13_26970 [Chloroflexia bacterium SDU3-3]|nr:hypothetical protein F8S13_26970 [Chloroflexia bacterium SDU3-3]
MTTETLAQVRDLVRSLTTPEKRLLLSDLTAQLLPSAMQASSTIPAPFPTFPHAIWTPDLPQWREDRYDDNAR